MAEKLEKCLDEKQEPTEPFGFGIRHIQMACMWLTMAALFMARGSMGVAVLAMSDEERRNDTSITIYDWDKRTQSVILSSFFWGYVIMQIPGGVLAKKFGGKPILLFALLANGTICLLIPMLAALGGWPAVCASRVVMGLTQACLYPTSHTLLGQWLPPNEQTSYTGIVYGGVQIGTILTMPISGFLADTALGWKMIFYALAGILFTTAAIWYALAASTPKCHRMISIKEITYIESKLNVEGSEKRPRTPWKAILTSRGVWAILAPQFGYCMSFVFFFVDLPTYLEKGLGISLRNSASLSALPYIGMWFGGTVSSILSEKIINLGLISVVASRKIFGSIAIFGVALGLVSLSFINADQKTLAIIVLITTLTASGFATAGHTVNQLDLSPNYAGVIMSLVNCVANVGSVVVPLITGLVLGADPTDVSGWRIVFLIHASTSIISNTIFLMFGTSDRQEWDDPDFLDKQKTDPEEMQALNKEKEAEANKTQVS